MRTQSDPPSLDAQALEARLAFFRITPDDLKRLQALQVFARESMSEIVEQFYDHLLSQPETHDFLDDPQVVARLKEKQTTYFLQIFEGRIDAEYVRNRLEVGAVHARLSVPPRWYIGAFTWYLELVRSALAKHEDDVDEARQDYEAIERVMHFDASLAMDAYIHGHLDDNRRQRAAIRELATPVIRVHDRVVMLPLVGTVDSARAQQVMESVLTAISQEQAQVLLLDIAGVAVVDTQVADYLLKTTDAVRLLGAQTILTGISAQVARTIVELGVDLSSLHTRNTLADGLQLALSLLGKRITDVADRR
ncbi:MAG: STAS domain-containing protein [Myxococcales bacterium]|nr:STAS domain-containing protein [Myxococcales bacterium]